MNATRSHSISETESDEALSIRLKKAFFLENAPSKFVGKGRRKRKISLEQADFSAPPQSSGAYLIVGFDTEYQSAPNLHTIQELRENPSLADREVLSYQYSVLSPCGLFYNGIVYPNDSHSFDREGRLLLEEFIYIALSDGVTHYGLKNIPERLYLVGHFNRADLPTFKNIDELSKKLDSLRGTFMSMKGGINNSIYVGYKLVGSESPTILSIGVRDTITLTPNLRTKLSDIGELVGVEKVKLHSDPLVEKRLKSNMKDFMLSNPDLFETYALRDSDICVRYLQTMISLYEQNVGRSKVPFTLSQIGVDILLQHWDSLGTYDGQPYKLAALGMETVKDQYFKKDTGRSQYFNRDVLIDSIYFHQLLVTECYHGGRNEQFQFGVSREDSWFDYDLTSAYPISMSLLGFPRWERVAFFRDNALLDALSSPHQLLFAQVEFRFPSETRFPCLPVRSKSGPIFPLEGTAFASAPELYLAMRLKCELKVIQGLHVPVDETHHPFHGFIKHTVTMRKQQRDIHGKGSMNEIFWKEVTNSVYGKVAQGLGFKRRYDLRQRGGRDLEPSKVTQPYYAAHITSYIRATLGEIMNLIPKGKCVFSVTTDGFITNVGGEEIESCCSGRLMSDFSQMVRDIRGDSSLEVKHRVDQLIGWKTRGQATLKSHPGSPIVLAKGGIQAPPELDSVEEDNDWIVHLFLNRRSDYVLLNSRPVGIRDMVDSGEAEFDLDFTFLKTSKLLNMEFDWKRCPSNPFQVDGYSQVSFNTVPWKNVVQLEKFRDLHYSKGFLGGDRCVYMIKSREDLADLVAAYNVKESHQPGDKRMYTFHQSDDMKRLRRDLVVAYKQELCGFVRKPPIEVNRDGMFRVLTAERGFSADAAEIRIERLTDKRLAEYLTGVLGIPVTKKDLDNAKRSRFTPHRSRPSPKVYEKLSLVKQTFPNLDVSEFVMDVSGLEDRDLIRL